MVGERATHELSHSVLLSIERVGHRGASAGGERSFSSHRGGLTRGGARQIGLGVLRLRHLPLDRRRKGFAQLEGVLGVWLGVWLGRSRLGSVGTWKPLSIERHWESCNISSCLHESLRGSRWESLDAWKPVPKHSPWMTAPRCELAAS